MAKPALSPLSDVTPALPPATRPPRVAGWLWFIGLWGLGVLSMVAVSLLFRVLLHS